MKIHDIIRNEPILHDADGGFVSEAWVRRRLRIVSRRGREICGFLLYDFRRDDESYYIHMVWVKPKYRRTGCAKDMIKNLCVRARMRMGFNAKLIFAYANPDGVKLCRSCGFKISDIPYREVVLQIR